MSAACKATFALIAMSAALPSNKILTVTPEINRPKGRLPGHSNTLGHFWLSLESHTKGKLEVVIQHYCITAGVMRPLFPFRPIDSFQNLMKLWVAKPRRPRRTRTDACACVSTNQREGRSI